MPACLPRCSPLLQFLYLIYLVYFHLLTDTPTQRPLINPFAINSLRTLFIATGGVPLLGASTAYALLPIHYLLSFQIRAHSFAFLCTFLRLPKTQLTSFQSISPSFQNTPWRGRTARL